MTPPDALPNLDDPASFQQAVAEGYEIFGAGDAAADLYIVQEGRVALTAGDHGAPVAIVEAGGVFGEEALAGGPPRTVSARALTDSRLIRLDRASYDRLVGEAPHIAALVVRQLAHRLVAQSRAAAVAAPSGSASAPAAEAKRAVPQGDPVLIEVVSGTEFPLAGLSEATVGRPDRASGFVPEVDLTKLDVDRTLSRRHARLVRRDQSWFVREEAGTRNGTFVNGTRITTGDEVALHDGDAVQFGFVKTVVRWR